MSTREFLISSWPVHGSALVIALVIAAGFVFQCRPSSNHAGRRLVLLGAALAVLLLSLDSPLDALADGYLFSAHMLQHLLLLLVVPVLLLCALDEGAEREGRHGSNSPHEEVGAGGLVQRRWQQSVRAIGNPLVTWLAGVGSMWFWHVPTLCNAATSIPTVRTVQTVSLLVLGSLFWWPIIGPNRRRRLAPLAGVLYLFTACVGCTLLGIIITFAPVSVCPVYLHPSDKLGLLQLIRNNWGLTPAVDQQVGGLLMWVPACLIYLCGIIGLLARWYGTPATQTANGRQSAAEPTTA